MQRSSNRLLFLFDIIQNTKWILRTQKMTTQASMATSQKYLELLFSLIIVKHLKILIPKLQDIKIQPLKVPLHLWCRNRNRSFRAGVSAIWSIQLSRWKCSYPTHTKVSFTLSQSRSIIEKWSIVTRRLKYWKWEQKYKEKEQKEIQRISPWPIGRTSLIVVPPL